MKVFIGRHKHPFVKQTLKDKTKAIPLICMIDTGFAGGIAIPKSLETTLSWRVFMSQEWKLADGNNIELDVYQGRVELNKCQIEDIGAIFVNGNEGLVGMEFLMDKKLVFDVKKNLVELE